MRINLFISIINSLTIYLIRRNFINTNIIINMLINITS
nr:MAG TPA: hypothetical protein [Caudoviricetes sp.]